MLDSWFALTCKMVQLGFAAQNTAVLRLMRLAAGGTSSQLEATRIVNEKPALAEVRIIGTTAGVTKELEKSKSKISNEAERERREKALDEALENTFPASDPIAAEQPV
jgi:hypothetical protein